MSKVELYERIRLAERDEGLSIRDLAIQFKVHRREVRRAVSGERPGAGASGGAGLEAGTGVGAVARVDSGGPGRRP